MSGTRKDQLDTIRISSKDSIGVDLPIHLNGKNRAPISLAVLLWNATIWKRWPKNTQRNPETCKE